MRPRTQTPSEAQELLKAVNPGSKLEKNSLLPTTILVETINEAPWMEEVEDELHLPRRGISRRENAVDRLDVRVLEVVVDRLPHIKRRGSSGIYPAWDKSSL
jgi:hypothetical protein